MRKYFSGLALLMAFGLLAAACGSDSAETEVGADAVDSGDACTAERVGGELTFGTFTPTPGLDPVQINGFGGTGAIENAAVYDTLMRYDANNGEYVPHLADSMEPNDDMSVWTMTLPDDVTFSNGDTLDAEAVKSSIERHTADESPSQIKGLMASTLASIEVVDAQTVEFTLVEPWTAFPYLLSRTPGMITNPAVVAEIGAESLLLDPTGAGTGPYTVSRFVPGEELVLEARPDYWGGPVCIETLSFIWVPGAGGTWEAFEAGDVQGAFLREAAVGAQATDAGVVDFRFLKGAGGVVLMNNADGPAADVRVRKAVQLAIDVDLFNDRVNDGQAIATSAVVSEESRLFSDDIAGLSYDPDAAAALVEEVKAEGDWDGHIDLLCHNAPSRASWPVAMEAQLEAVGFDVNVVNDGDINSVIKAVYVDRVYDLVCWGYQIEDELPFNAMLNFQSGNGANVIGYDDPAMDEAIANLKIASSASEEQNAMVQVQEIWNSTVPSAIYESVEELVAFDDSVHGVLGSSASTILFHDAYLGG